MSDDLVMHLRAEADAHADGDWNDQVIRRLLTEAADAIEALYAEIELLRAALALAVGELSTHGEHRHTNPLALMQEFLKEARRER